MLYVCSRSNSSSAGAVCLSSTRGTRFHPVPIDENLLELIYQPREVGTHVII